MKKGKMSFYVETMNHIIAVQGLLKNFEIKLRERALNHDRSKTEEPEFSLFAEATKDWRQHEYGSPEYYQAIEKHKDTIELHYKNNRHHPEHFDNGIDDMTLVDLIEMLCDWMARSRDVEKSLKINKERFNINKQLMNIIRNTVDEI